MVKGQAMVEAAFNSFELCKQMLWPMDELIRVSLTAVTVSVVTKHKGVITWSRSFALSYFLLEILPNKLLDLLMQIKFTFDLILNSIEFHKISCIYDFLG